MKKLLLSIGLLAVTATFAMAQNGNAPTISGRGTAVKNVNQGTATITDNGASKLKPENMVFNEDTHDFGTIPEGPQAEFEFKFKNTGTEPIVISGVHASCGCTTPSYSKEPVKPGETGTIKAVYNTQGRPTPFNKSITVASNAGTKVLVIKGTVEKAPDSSVPKNNSMMKMN